MPVRAPGGFDEAATTAGAPGARPLGLRTATTTVVAQVAARVASLAVVLAGTALVTRSVGPVGFADWATVLSLVTMFGFALDPGLTPVVVRRLVQAPASAPRPQVLLRARLAVAAAALAIVVAVTAILRGSDATLLALVLGGQLLPRAVVLNAAPWLQARHRLHRQTLLELGTSLLGLVGLVVAVAAGAPRVVLALVGFLIPLWVLAALMRRELRLAAPAPAASPAPDEERAQLRGLLREVAPLGGALLLGSLYLRIDVVFVNVAESARGVAAYLVAYQFIEQLIVLAVILSATLLPLLAARAQTHALLQDRLVLDGMLLMGLLGTLGSLGLVALAEPLLRALGGRDLAGGVPLLRLLAPSSAILLVGGFFAYLFAALELNRRYLLFNAVGLVFNVAAGLVLVLPYGAPAAARITWATEIVIIALVAREVWRASPPSHGPLLRLGLLAALAVAVSESAVAEPGLLPVAGVVVAGTVLAAAVAWPGLVRGTAIVRDQLAARAVSG